MNIGCEIKRLISSRCVNPIVGRRQSNSSLFMSGAPDGCPHCLRVPPFCCEGRRRFSFTARSLCDRERDRRGKVTEVALFIIRPGCNSEGKRVLEEAARLDR
ncbi:hypothetical protein Zmor_009134 [Zophobas morio]|uniref:Uncharacterized protein n=1 Tax=Zophobas morio TaxID=2755281 RepID=A0AA38MID0_9CUCU|nr:hypothetical protein Zmor_009134 [Zophobas morio]